MDVLLGHGSGRIWWLWSAGTKRALENASIVMGARKPYRGHWIKDKKIIERACEADLDQLGKESEQFLSLVHANSEDWCCFPYQFDELRLATLFSRDTTYYSKPSSIPPIILDLHAQ